MAKLIEISKVESELTSHGSTSVLKKVMLKNGEIPHLTGFSQAIFKSGDNVENHVHKDMYELFFVLEGVLEVGLKDDKIVVPKNSAIVIEPGEEHSMSNAADEDCIVIYFGIVA